MARLSRMSFWSMVVVFASVAAVAGAGERTTPNGDVLFQAYNPSAGGLAQAGDSTIRTYNSATTELYADTMAASLTMQRQFARVLPSIADYSQTAHKVSSANGSYCAPDANWVMWDTPFLTHEARRTNDDYMGYRNTSSGFATGISRMLGETTAVGLALGYDARKMTNRDGYHWRNRADAFHAAIYGGTALGCLFVDGYAGYSRSWQRTERDMEFANDYARYHGNFNDTILSGGLKASYVLILPNEMRITPSIGLDYSYIRTGSFYESGSRNTGGVGYWAVDKASHHSLQTPIMVSANRTFSANFLTFGGACSLWTPEVRAGYVTQFGAKRTSVRARTIDGSLPHKYSATSNEIGGSYGTIGTGLKIKIRDKFIFAVDYDYTFGDKYSNHTVTGTYGVSF